jgi:hypothetical protein
MDFNECKNRHRWLPAFSGEDICPECFSKMIRSIRKSSGLCLCCGAYNHLWENVHGSWKLCDICHFEWNPQSPKVQILDEILKFKRPVA